MGTRTHPHKTYGVSLVEVLDDREIYQMANTSFIGTPELESFLA
jgi:hypothetical protein